VHDKRDAAGNMVRIVEKRGAYRFLLGKSEKKTPLGRPRLRWENNIKSGFQETGWEGVNWFQLAQEKGQIAGGCESSNEIPVSIKCGTFHDQLRHY